MVPSDSETQGYILVQSKHKTYDHVLVVFSIGLCPTVICF